MLAIGTVLDGKFRVDGVIGAGGMGIVLAATQLELGRNVCLKVMLPQLASRPDARARFTREARLASRLRGEHACAVYDVTLLENGTPCIVMERIDGRDLAAEVAERGPLPIAEAMAIVDQVCDAIAEAHALGIVHRDLKPHNLLLSRRLDGTPLVKVVDFGIAAAVGDDGATTGALGSPAFMAPEQARRGKADARADLYSLGAVLYYLVTGKPPFTGDSALDVLVKLQTDTPPKPSLLRPDLPPTLEAAICRSLDRRPDRRFPTVAAFQSALHGRGPAIRERHRSRIVIAACVSTLALAPESGGRESRPALVEMVPSTERAPPSSIRTVDTSVGPTVEHHGTSPLRAHVGARTSPSSPVTGNPRPRSRERGADLVGVAPDGTQRSNDRLISRDTEAPRIASESETMTVAPSAQPAPRCSTDDFLCQFGAPR